MGKDGFYLYLNTAYSHPANCWSLWGGLLVETARSCLAALVGAYCFLQCPVQCSVTLSGQRKGYPPVSFCHPIRSYKVTM